MSNLELPAGINIDHIICGSKSATRLPLHSEGEDVVAGEASWRMLDQWLLRLDRRGRAWSEPGIKVVVTAHCVDLDWSRVCCGQICEGFRGS